MLSAEAMLVHITVLVGISNGYKRHVGCFTNKEEHFGQDDNLVTREVKLLDRLAEDDF